jgi:biopolymer transport protein ExbB
MKNIFPMKPFLTFALASLLPLGLFAQDAESVAAAAKSDLDRALADLTAARQEVETARLPLARQLTEQEQALTDQRAALVKAERFQENQLLELNVLKAEARRQVEEVKYVESLLTEYTRAFRSRLNFVEEPRYQDLFTKLDAVAANADLPPVEVFSQRAELLIIALDRIGKVQGGELMDGRALDKQGFVQKGKVAIIGPIAIFAGERDDTVGLLQQELNRPDPTVFTADKKLIKETRSLATTGTGLLLLDPTGGNALKLHALDEGIIRQLEKGGIAIIPIVILAACTLLVAAYKWRQLASIRLATEKDLQTVLGHLNRGDQASALHHARGISGISGNLLATAVEHWDEKQEYIEELLYEKMLAARTKLERGLAFLALAATTGPLLGLLGTVMGMIATFHVISTVGSGDPKMLAAGISEALICTATGMAVAIPALLFHSFLTRKAKGVIASMEQVSVGFINGVLEEVSPFA